MNWDDIKVSADRTHFVFEGKKLFSKTFIEVLKFHSIGIAPVLDESGAYHINTSGEEVYSNRYNRTFGFYFGLASVVQNNRWFHVDGKGKRVYMTTYAWTGNYQENICTVRNDSNQYYHIDKFGVRLYDENYIYAGDFKDGIACVKRSSGYYKHINNKGEFIYTKSFIDLGVFHKKHATAKDETGWFHIDINGDELYQQRYLLIEPFYNGYALVTKLDNTKQIIDESGQVIIDI